MRSGVFKFALPVISLFLMAGLTLAAQTTDSARVTSLLQHAKEHAAQARLDAEKIEGFTRSGTTWKSHSEQLRHMTEDVNQLGKDVAELTAARAEASPWQQEAIDHVDPLLRSLAGHMTAMIKHLDDNRNQVHMPAYVDYAKANYRLADRLLATINDYIDYAEVKSKTEALEQKLLPPPEGNPGQ